MRRFSKFFLRESRPKASTPHIGPKSLKQNFFVVVFHGSDFVLAVQLRSQNTAHWADNVL